MRKDKHKAAATRRWKKRNGIPTQKGVRENGDDEETSQEGLDVSEEELEPKVPAQVGAPQPTPPENPKIASNDDGEPWMVRQTGGTPVPASAGLNASSPPTVSALGINSTGISKPTTPATSSSNGSETSPTTPNTFSRRKVKSNAWRYEEMREEDMDEEALEALRREQEETELLLEYARGKGGENIENEVIEDAFTEIPWYLRKDLPADKLNPHAYMKVDVATLLKKVNPEKSSDIDSQPKSHIERNFASTKTKRMFTTNPDADSLQKKTEAEDELDDILKLANRKGPTSSVTKPVGTKAQLNDTDIDDFMAELGLSDQNAPQKHSHPSNNATTKAAQDLGWLDSLLS